MQLSRRSLLVGTAGVTLALSAAHAAQPKTLRLANRVFQPSGAWGLTLDEGERFDVRLENALDVPSGLHWHGLNPPWRQDGVPYISAPPIPPGKSADYDFVPQPPGTRWMHSHFGLQEQDLLAAPLIVRETNAIKSGLQEIVVLLEDFSWKNPTLLLEELRKPKSGANKPAMTMSAPGASMGSGRMDLNDVTYDAFI